MPTIKMDGTKISYTDSGAGDPVIALHCSASTGGQWAKMAQELAPAYRTLAPDFHCCGESGPWSHSRPVTIADETETVAAVMSKAGAPFHLVGHSFGGAVALRVALEWPSIVKSLTLIEPVAFHLLAYGSEPEQSLFSEIAHLAKGLSDDTAAGRPISAMGRFVDYWNGAGTWNAMPFERRVDMAARAPRVIQDFHATMTDTTPRAAYRWMTVPTLILAGERTQAPARGICDMLAGILPSRELRVVEGAGHMLPLTHPRTVNAAIAEHISRFNNGLPLAA